MLPGRSSHLSGHLQLLLLTLAVLVVVAQTAPEGWLRKCYYGLGKCRKSCRDNEKKKGICMGKRSCCIDKEKAHLSRYENKDKSASSNLNIGLTAG
ncbi:beta-defensin 115 [Ochotona curzoniae]|uniref:beta-defensin 115 n=1 Tax=Ochotona curzoniae TaxID=130825 RepID=UPI001B3471F5|nr:beta-defensin 115 [Ochotona curzoniae]